MFEKLNFSYCKQKLELSLEENRQLREEFHLYKSEMNQRVESMSREMEMLYETIAKLQIRVSDVAKQQSHTNTVPQISSSPPPQPTPPPMPTPQRITSHSEVSTHRLEVPQSKPLRDNYFSEDEDDDALKIKEIEDLKNEYLNYSLFLIYFFHHYQFVYKMLL